MFCCRLPSYTQLRYFSFYLLQELKVHETIMAMCNTPFVIMLKVLKSPRREIRPHVVDVDVSPSPHVTPTAK